MGADPTKWSNRALENYQRARSGPVIAIHADGSRETIPALEANRRARAARKARGKIKHRRRSSSA